MRSKELWTPQTFTELAWFCLVYVLVYFWLDSWLDSSGLALRSRA